MEQNKDINQGFSTNISTCVVSVRYLSALLVKVSENFSLLHFFHLKTLRFG